MSRILLVSEGETDREILRYYVCPVCRYLFKCRNMLNFTGVVCPGCNHLIRIDKVAASSASSSVQMAGEFNELKVPKWEKESEMLIAGKFGRIGKVMTTSIILGTTLMTARAGWKAVGDLNKQVVVNVDQIDGEGRSKQESLLLSAESFVEALFTSRSAEDAKKYFSLDGEKEAQYDSFYRKNKWVEIKKVKLNGGFLDDGRWIKFEAAELATAPPIFIDVSSGGMKIDWPSFVGYSENNPHEFLTVDPLEKEEFRVKIGVSKNYDFSQTEDEWHVVAMKFGGEVEKFYGYASLSDQKLVNQLKVLTRKEHPLVILELQPIKGEEGLNKFIITRVVSEDWLER